jgi:transcriptional regulator with XRE-family HTH domain
MLMILIKDKDFKEILIRQGLSQRAFSEKAGISSPFLSQVLQGKRNPGPKTSKKMCDSLGVEFDDIFFIENGYKSKQNKSA